MLVPHLIRGAALSPFRRPGPNRKLPAARAVVPGVRVDERRLAAYTQVCGFARSDGGALPVTYPHVLGFPLAMRLMSGWDFPLPLLGLVHTSIVIRRLRELPSDTAYELTVYAAQLTPHRRGTEAHLVTEVRDGGELVWESRSTYLARHATAADGSDSSAAASNGSGYPAADGSAVPDEVARELPVAAEWRLGGDLGRRYGAASKDRNPIHLHPLTARAFGFPRAIAHGMWSVARCLAEYGAPEPVAVRAEFKKPVLLPATVRYAAQGESFALRGGADGTRVHLVGTVNALTAADGA